MYNRVLTALAIVTVIYVAISLGDVYANDEQAKHDEQVSIVEEAIETLQPWYARARNAASRERRVAHRRSIARAIAGASKRYGFDPMVAVSIARRESSLIPAVGHGRIKGPNPKMRGFFQIWPDGVAERTCGALNGIQCNQYNVQCNAQTALCWLAKSRDWCGDDPWLYVGGYGRSRCPVDRAEALGWTEVRVARGFFCEVADCAREWPM